MDRGAVLAWAEARRRADDLERRLAREAPEKPDPIGLVFELMTLVEELHGWPLPPDPLSEREDLAARERWTRIRRAWASSRPPSISI